MFVLGFMKGVIMRKEQPTNLQINQFIKDLEFSDWVSITIRNEDQNAECLHILNYTGGNSDNYKDEFDCENKGVIVDNVLLWKIIDIIRNENKA